MENNEDLSLPTLKNCPWCKQKPIYVFYDKGVEIHCITETCPIMPIGGRFNNKSKHKSGNEIAIAWNSPATQSQKPNQSPDTNNKKNLMDYKSMRTELEVRKIMKECFVSKKIWEKYSDKPYGDVSG